MEWLETGTLNKLPIEDNLAKASGLLYLELYFQATKWGMQDLENLIMDRFRGRWTCGDGYFHAFLITKIYAETSSESIFR